MKLNNISLHDKNVKIAKMLGWYQDILIHGDKVWFKTTDTSIIVAYDTDRQSPYDLPFYRDWNYLMQAVEFIEDNYDGVSICSKSCEIFGFTDGYVTEKTKIEAVFNAVAEFAINYNKNQ